MRKNFIIIFFFVFYFFLFTKNSFAQANSPDFNVNPLITSVNQQNNVDNDVLKILIEISKALFWRNTNNTETNNTKTNYNEWQDYNDISLFSSFPEIKPTPDVNGYVYYSQCKGLYDNYPLPNGSTLCKAGCGPTTVAMILSSLVDNSFTPPKVVKEYKNRGYYLGESGSYYYDARSMLNSYGLKTTTIYANNLPLTIDQLMNQYGNIIKNYQDSGWTFFALANFCEEGCGHYFWIIKIDEQLNTWSYDPYYGIGRSRPYNQKERYPFPKYRIIFGVKK